MARRTADQTLDEWLVLSCAGGSERAFEELHRRWHPRLRAHAAYLLGPARVDRVDDICQEAWLAIAGGVRELREPALFRAWAYSIVTRRVADLRRKLSRDERAREQLQSAGQEPSNASPDQAAGESLRHALQSLPHEDRALLRLFYLDEMSVAETAAALEIPAGTVKSRLFHARRRLRQVLQRRPT